MAGAVGRDSLAASALTSLRAANVDLTRVIEVEASTGCAAISVDPAGGNAISVGSGANLAVSHTQIEDALLAAGSTLILQMEVPAEETAALIHRAHDKGARIILNLAPAAPFPEDALRKIDVLIVNETEGAWLSNRLKCDNTAHALRRALGVTVVRTLGGDGLESASADGVQTIQAYPIVPFDTTAAGDCFVGVLAASLDRGATLTAALQRATAAAALCCERAGSQGSIPAAHETDASFFGLPCDKRRHPWQTSTNLETGEAESMNKQDIERAAHILVQARRDMKPLDGLPAGLKPTTFEQAHAIQDAVSHELGQLIAGFKAMAPAEGEPTRGVIYGGTIHPSPCHIQAVKVPQCGVEAEVAFIFRRDLPSREKPYTRNEVAAVLDACAAIEVVHSRFAQKAPVSNLEKLADSISNGGLVHSEPRSDWRDLQLGKLKVTLAINGKNKHHKTGGHPTGDPLGVAVVLANIWREKGGVRAGQFVTCGSFTGLDFLKPGDVCTVKFEGLGSAEVKFVKQK